MRVAVTGAQGFVGRYFVSHMLAARPDVSILGFGRSQRSDRTFTHSVRNGAAVIAAPLPAGVQQTLSDERYGYLASDLHDLETLSAALRSFHPEAVVHLASALRDDDASRLVATNIGGSLSLLDAVVQSGCTPRVIVMGSTGGVYGAPRTLPINEDAACVPVDPYSASKFCAEVMTAISGGAHGLPLLWARLFNIVGPGQDERHVCGRFAAQATAISRGTAPPVLEAGNLDSTRDIIDVRDVAAALAALIDAGAPGEAYNVATGRETRIAEVLALTLEAAGIAGDVRIDRLPARPGDIPRHVAGVGKLGALGFKATIPIAMAIRDVVGYYMDVAGAGA